MRFSTRPLVLPLALVALALFTPPSTVTAAKAPADSSLVIDDHRAVPSLVRGDRRVNRGTGAPLALFKVGHQVILSEPEDMARQYLSARASLLRLKDPELGDLIHHASRETLAGSTARFRQLYRGVPVYQGEIAVSMDRDAKVQFVANSYKPEIDLDTVEPVLRAAEARAIALEYLGVRGRLEVDRSALNVYQNAGVTRLVYKIDLLSVGTPQGEWEVLVNAISGELVRARDVAYYGVPATVDGTGDAFDPDPLSSALADYGDPGFVDGADADTPQLAGEVFSRTLRDITLDGGIHSLTGPWAECVDWDTPFKGCFSQASSTFTFNRSDDGFEAVNGYFHIDTYMRYLNETLGLAIEPFQYPGGAQFDPHGFAGADNSSYSSSTGRLRFGEGGVDDAEDADVLIHELGHGLHDWATVGGLSQVEGLSEGIGDYAAVAYSRSFNQWPPASPQYNWVFSWDGHNPFWGGRVTDWTNTHTYPDDLGGSIHTNGQFWSSCNLQIYDAIGRNKTETAHWEGIKMLGGASNQLDAAQAVLQAAINLGYSGADIATMQTIFQGCGYTVTSSLIFSDGFESGNTSLWDSAVP